MDELPVRKGRLDPPGRLSGLTMPRCLLACTSIALTLLSVEARAQGNYRGMPTGGRSALQGNTGIALASDGSSPFLNPATIVRIEDASLAFSVSFLSFDTTHISDWHQPGAVDTRRFGAVSLRGTSESTTRLDILPSTLCLFFTIAGWGDPEDTALAPPSRHVIAPKSGRQKLAACLATTEDQELRLPALGFVGGTPGGATHTAQSFTQSWRRVRVGPSYAVDLTDDLSLGVSVHGVLTNTALVRSSNAITSDVAGRPVATTLDAAGHGHSIDLDATLGATYRAKNLTFGVVAKPPGVHVEGAYDATLHQQVSSGQSSDVARLSTGSGNFRAPTPAHVGVGVGAVFESWRGEVNASYAFSLDRALLTTMHVTSTSSANGASSSTAADTTFSVRGRPVVNVAAGAEYFVTPTSSVLGGIATDITSVPELTTATSIGTLYASRASRVAGSIGVGSYGDAGTLLVGAQVALGWGQALAVNPYVLPNEYAVASMRTYGVLLVVAGSTNLRALKRAAESVQQIFETKEPSPVR